ncbi:hypothetical protein FLONG3_11441 [Fusarium longipes]|uniref:Uncharacterized protein n=1 Tax=Fusarium longipes TaxID=694270 RepID=A0A395RDU2_9HYPO|nr:hypothetical protein FLONG3_11441 [Fusarium longipes]
MNLNKAANRPSTPTTLWQYYFFAACLIISGVLIWLSLRKTQNGEGKAEVPEEAPEEEEPQEEEAGEEAPEEEAPEEEVCIGIE